MLLQMIDLDDWRLKGQKRESMLMKKVMDAKTLVKVMEVEPCWEWERAADVRLMKM